MFALSEVVWFIGGTGAISVAGLALETAWYYKAWTRHEEIGSKSYAPIQSSPVFKYRILRVIACFVFVALTFVSFTRNSLTVIQQITTSASVLYALSLSIISVLSSSRLANITNRHLNVLLLAFFGVYAVRDLWPLAKVHGNVLDSGEGHMLWFKITSLAVAGIVIPLTTPRQAYPPAINHLEAKVNPEETASILSLLSHSYLDSFIFNLYRTPTRLKVEDVPPLAEADHSGVLMPGILSILDPPTFSPPYLFWGLFRAFRTRVFMLIGLQLLQTALSFVAPIGIKQVLSYLEHNGEGATIRPWVWVSWLFFGPFLKAVFSQLYTYISSRNHVHINGVLNQVLLRHSLRIRIDSGSSSDSKGNNFMGKLNNLAASDASEVAILSELWIVFLCFPFELALSLWFLFDILGWSAFIGFAFMLLCAPVPGYMTKLLQKIQFVKKQKTDARVQSVTEALGVIRMAKLFGWEIRLQSQITSKRGEELALIKKSKLYELLNSHANLLISMFTIVVSYGIYTAVMKKELTASTVFSSLAVFEMIRTRVRVIVINIPTLVQGKVALDRLDEFLRKTEMLDRFILLQSEPNLSDHSLIGFRDAEFRWSNERDFQLIFEGTFSFRQDCINLILGPTGSGKTSLLLALLGEMCYSPKKSGGYYNLPREHGVSYAAQESWIQNDTVKNNILFGSDYNEERYNTVLYQCALLKDLSLFDAGDMTEVGEKGLTLSGGQKVARVTLARAVYSSAQIVLLDDPLSALDVHTAKWVVEKCLKGQLIQGRTVLLVTHNIALAAPIAQHAVHVALNGDIMQGSVEDVIQNDKLLASRSLEDKKNVDSPSESIEQECITERESAKSAIGLILAEEMEIGHVSWNALKLYFSGFNRHPVIFFFCLIFITTLNALNFSLQAWFLGYWSTQYDVPKSSVSVSWFLSVYIALILLSISLYSFAFTLWILGSLRSSRIIHHKFIESIVSSTFRWLDTTPTSRILTRATADIRSIDNSMASGTWRLLGISTMMIVDLGSVMVFAPIFLVPGIVIVLLGVYFGQVYIGAQLPMRRLMSVYKAPILGTFTTAVSGLVSIRAYGAEEMFLRQSRAQIDTWLTPAIPSYNVNRWIAIRTNALAGLFTAGLGGYLVYGNGSVSAANTGFSVTMAVTFTSLILTWVRSYNDVELEANCLERIQHYLDIDHEDEKSSEGIPPAYWPSGGALQIEGLCARYSKDGVDVLHDVTFSVRSGERIGIVGRTGSGKSSLTLALLRAIPTSGQILYDGLSIHRLNLDVLRSNITIIPQIPELLTGTLRYNLDPFSDHDDSKLNDALRSAGLFALQGEDAQNRLSLDSEIRGGGNNLSVGIRQIVALARAIVRGSKLLILDEATSSVDHQTDSIIQQTLRHELGDVTLMTVAHRLATVMDFDRIMVLDEGRIAEFGSPAELLKEGGMFHALVNESPDKTELYAMVGEDL